MSAVRILLFCLAAAALSACDRPLTTSGTYLTDSQTQAIGVGTSLEALVELYGPPSYTSPVDPSLVAYIGTRLENRIFQQPRPVDRRIVALDMRGGLVRDLALIDLRDGRQITPSPARTPTNGRTITLVEELLGNIGRF